MLGDRGILGFLVIELLEATIRLAGMRLDPSAAMTDNGARASAVSAARCVPRSAAGPVDIAAYAF